MKKTHKTNKSIIFLISIFFYSNFAYSRPVNQEKDSSKEVDFSSRHSLFLEEIEILSNIFFKECTANSFQEKCFSYMEKIKDRTEEIQEIEKFLISLKADFKPYTIANKVKKILELSSLFLKKENEESQKKPLDDLNHEKFLWSENKNLEAKDFFKKYKSEFFEFGINLTFYEDKLIDTNGTIHEQIQWDSHLEKWLSMSTGDYKKSKIIAESFYRYIFPKTYFNPDLTYNFIWFLFKYNVYIGAEPKYFKMRLSLYQDLTSFFSNPENECAFNNFLSFISENLKSKEKENKETSEKYKVLIITGNYGGGHITAAQTIENLLKKNPNTEVEVINECLDFPDPLSVATNNKFRGCQTFNDFTYKEGNERKATLMNILNFKLGDYIAPNHFELLYSWIKEFDPNQIISTIHHVEQISAAAYQTLIPISILITDYEFPDKQWFHLNHVDPELIKYLFPATDKNFFRRIASHYISKNWEAQVNHSRTHKIFKEFFESKNNSFLHDVTDLFGIFYYSEIPVSGELSIPKDHNHIMEDRLALNLSTNKDRKIISIAYGSSSNTNAITSVIKKIKSESDKIKSPIQIAVLSSGNKDVMHDVTELFNEIGIPLEDSESSIDLDIKITGKIFGRLSYPIEMSKIYRASDIFISKSGGATTAELIKSGTYFIRGFSLWPWEVENSKYLESIGLSSSGSNKTSNGNRPFEEDLNTYSENVSSSDLRDQINELIDKPRRLKKNNQLTESADYLKKMNELIQIFSIDKKAAQLHIKTLTKREKKTMITSYLEDYIQELTPLNSFFELNFKVFLHVTNLMFPEINLFHFFKESGMKNIPTLAGIKMIIENDNKFSYLKEHISVMNVDELSHFLDELKKSGFKGEKILVISHIWAHFTPVFIQINDFENKIIISDSINKSNNFYWVENIKKHIKSSQLRIDEIIAFENPRQCDLLSCFTFSIEDILDHSKENIFKYVNTTKKDLTSFFQLEQTPEKTKHIIMKKYPARFLKIAQYLSILKTQMKESIDNQSFDEFINPYIEPGLVSGSVKEINFYARKKAFGYMNLIIQKLIEDKNNLKRISSL